MIDTEQTIVIAAPIEVVWGHAKDIAGWARLMPGLQDCDIVDEDDSRWTLKVGVGAMVRTVKVFVHVDRWAGPDAVDFSYRLEGDPVNGGGTYRARRLGAGETEIALGVRVIGEGPMAPMWEAMGKPLLPKFARAFAEQFKTEIESASPQPSRGEAGAAARPHSNTLWAIVAAWLRRLLGKKRST
jgi:carbon monoxide dehydrogenase subunit G